jgi:hypothetical protein
VRFVVAVCVFVAGCAAAPEVRTVDEVAAIEDVLAGCNVDEADGAQLLRCDDVVVEVHERRVPFAGDRVDVVADQRLRHFRRAREAGGVVWDIVVVGHTLRGHDDGSAGGDDACLSRLLAIAHDKNNSPPPPSSAVQVPDGCDAVAADAAVCGDAYVQWIVEEDGADLRGADVAGLARVLQARALHDAVDVTVEGPL